MPPRNAPLPNAVNIFNCDVCDKGYPRQTDFENHLRSYDHCHRLRLAEMKRMTDAGAGDVPRQKGTTDMRAIPTGPGPRFTKLGPGAAENTGGSRFKKVGVVSEETKKTEQKEANKTEAEKMEAEKMEVEETDADKPEADKTSDEVEEADPKVDTAPCEKEEEKKNTVGDVRVESQVDEKTGSDTIMVEADEIVTWEEYDFTKPSECDHTNCSGCAVPTDAVYDENGWLVLGSP